MQLSRIFPALVLGIVGLPIICIQAYRLWPRQPPVMPPVNAGVRHSTTLAFYPVRTAAGWAEEQTVGQYVVRRVQVVSRGAAQHACRADAERAAGLYRAHVVRITRTPAGAFEDDFGTLTVVDGDGRVQYFAGRRTDGDCGWGIVLDPIGEYH